MRVAVIADVHGDLAALERVLAAIDRSAAEAIWCLGDNVGLGATAPARVVDLLRGRCALVLAGNHDRWVTGGLSLDMLPLPRQQTELEWQRAQLPDGQLRWLAGLPSHARCDDVSVWHGSAGDPLTGGIASRADAAAHLARQRTPIGLVGQTHRPMAAQVDGSGLRYDEHPQHAVLDRRGRMVLNPGAVIGARRWLELDLARRAADWQPA